MSRLEWRNIFYSNNEKDGTFRLRNRTTAILAINNKQILADKTLTLFAYFEAFHNFETDVVERYFTTLKYKAGLAYRFSPRWGVDFGTLFNNAQNTILLPSNSDTNVVTNVILEWGITYGIPQK